MRGRFRRACTTTRTCAATSPRTSSRIASCGWRGTRPAPSPASSCSTDDWVDHLYVDPARTGRGIGSRLLAVAKHERPHGLRLWTFASNTGAQRFYARHGFVEVRRTDGRDNEERAPDVLYAYRARGSPQVPL